MHKIFYINIKVFFFFIFMHEEIKAANGKKGELRLININLLVKLI